MVCRYCHNQGHNLVDCPICCSKTGHLLSYCSQTMNFILEVIHPDHVTNSKSNSHHAAVVASEECPSVSLSNLSTGDPEDLIKHVVSKNYLSKFHCTFCYSRYILVLWYRLLKPHDIWFWLNLNLNTLPHKHLLFKLLMVPICMSLTWDTFQHHPYLFQALNLILKLTLNLISIGQLVELGFDVLFSINDCDVQDCRTG